MTSIASIKARWQQQDQASHTPVTPPSPAPRPTFKPKTPAPSTESSSSPSPIKSFSAPSPSIATKPSPFGARTFGSPAVSSPAVTSSSNSSLTSPSELSTPAAASPSPSATSPASPASPSSTPSSSVPPFSPSPSPSPSLSSEQIATPPKVSSPFLKKSIPTPSSDSPKKPEEGKDETAPPGNSNSGSAQVAKRGSVLGRSSLFNAPSTEPLPPVSKKPISLPKPVKISAEAPESPTKMDPSSDPPTSGIRARAQTLNINFGPRPPPKTPAPVENKRRSLVETSENPMPVVEEFKRAVPPKRKSATNRQRHSALLPTTTSSELLSMSPVAEVMSVDSLPLSSPLVDMSADSSLVNQADSSLVNQMQE